MKKLITALAVAAITMSSCSRDKYTIHPQENVSNPALKDGKDDHDGPIIMEIVRNAAAQPIVHAHVTFISGTDTVRGYTNSEGASTLQLTGTGEWYLIATHEDYQTLQTSVNVTDSFAQRIDVMYP